ncbi:MAG: RNA polymerase sporulation sigma factor SigH [Blautia sp.]|nr:RNA polymerase sporulation sigma factor SigH [Blautia sp.]
MSEYDKMSDEDLIRSLRNGDQGVSDYLMEKYKGMVRQKARAVFLIGGDTDDLIQEGMIGLFKAVRDYQPDREASFLTFARMCVERQIYTAIHSSNRQKNMPLNSYVSLSDETDAPEDLMKVPEFIMDNPESIVISQENERQLRESINQRLSKMEIRVLELYLKGESYVRIGAILNKPPKAIDNALQRIRKKIKESMEE